MKKKIPFVSVVTALLCFGSGIAPMAKVAADEPAEQRYYDAVSLCDATSEIVTFTSKETVKITTIGNCPMYYSNDYSNVCGPVAGSMLVGFYDRYYEDLIPDYTAYLTSTGNYKTFVTTPVSSVISSLYTLMRTNVDDVGVSRTDFLNGLSDYVESKDLTMQYTAVDSGASFNYSTYKTSIDANKPVVLFCNNVVLYTFSSSNDTSENIVGQTISGGHIIVGYGYYEVDYYNGDTISRSEKYALVASGWATPRYAYVNVEETSWYNNGYSVLIS